MTVIKWVLALGVMTLGLGLTASAQGTSGSESGASAPPTHIPADQQATIDQAVAARREGCRLHPGTCKRGRKAPPQSNSPPKVPDRNSGGPN